MNTPENRYHWISRKALEPMSKALRMMALPELMTTAARINHMANLPMSSVIESINLERRKSAVTDVSSRTRAALPLWRAPRL